MHESAPSEERKNGLKIEWCAYKCIWIEYYYDYKFKALHKEFKIRLKLLFMRNKHFMKLIWFVLYSITNSIYFSVYISIADHFVLSTSLYSSNQSIK